MNRLCTTATTLCLYVCLSPTLFGQKQTFLGFNGSGWPSNLQVRGVIQASWERKNSALQVELGYVRRENITIHQPIPNTGLEYYQPVIGAVEASAFWKFGFKFERIRIFALLGPSISHGVEAEAFIRQENSDPYPAVVPWRHLGIRRWEVGTYQGLGLESVGHKGVKIQIDFRYYLGLTDLFPGEDTAFNQGPLLGIGIALPIHHSVE